MSKGAPSKYRPILPRIQHYEPKQEYSHHAPPVDRDYEHSFPQPQPTRIEQPAMQDPMNRDRKCHFENRPAACPYQHDYQPPVYPHVPPANVDNMGQLFSQHSNMIRPILQNPMNQASGGHFEGMPDAHYRQHYQPPPVYPHATPAKVDNRHRFSSQPSAVSQPIMQDLMYQTVDGTCFEDRPDVPLFQQYQPEAAYNAPCVYPGNNDNRQQHFAQPISVDQSILQNQIHPPPTQYDPPTNQIVVYGNPGNQPTNQVRTLPSPPTRL